MSLLFYFVPQSTASITEGVLDVLGIPCDRVQLDIQNGDTRTPAFLALNPNGRVPVIVHDDTPIWESAAITMYLGEVFGVDAGLYPALGPKRGEAMKWITWSNVTLAEAAGRLAATLPQGSDGGVVEGSRDWVPAEQRSAAAREKAEGDLVACLGILDRALEGKAFLLGGYCLADTHVQGFVGWIEGMGVELAPFVNVRQWAARTPER